MLAKQIKFVLLTLAYRRWTWLILGFSAFQAVLMTSAFSNQRDSLEWVRPVIAPYAESVKDSRELSSLGPEVPVKIRLAQTGLIFERLRSQHRVVALSFDTVQADPRSLAQLRYFPQLEALDLGDAWSEGVPDLGVLRQLTGLRRLDLNRAVSARTSLSPLQALPSLEELALRRTDALTPEHLDQIAALPALKVLYLPDLTGQAKLRKQLSRLEASASLKTVYLPLKDPRDSALYAVRKELEKQSVRRGYVGPSAMTLFAPLFPIVFLLIGLSWQIAAWFSGVDAVLRPGYQRPHRIVAWSILGTFILSVCIFMVSTGRPVFPMLSFVGLAVVAMVRSNLWAGTRRGAMRSVVEAGVMLFLLGFFVAIMSPSVGPWIDAYVWGDFPWLSGGLAVAAVALAVDFDVRLRTMARDRVVNHRPALMSAEDLKADGEAMQFVAADAPPTGWWPRPPRPKRAWARLLPFLIFGFIAWPSLKELFFRPGGADQLAQSLAIGGTMPLLFIIVSIFSQRWWQRFPLLATLMTRPPSRRTHTGRFFRAMAWDFLKLWPLPVLAAALAVGQRGGFGGDWAAASAVYALAAVGMIALVYATTLWMLPVRTQMLFALGSIGPLLIVWMVFAVPFGRSGISLPVIGVATAAMFVLAVVIFASARFRFEQLEWGKY